MSPSKPRDSNARTITFLAILCTLCAVILAVMASALAERQDKAKNLDRSLQMLIAAKICTPTGTFQVQEPQGAFSPAVWDATTGTLVATTAPQPPTSNEILAAYDAFFFPFLTDSQGQVKTFAQLGVSEDQYLAEHRKTGYATLPWKLLYGIRPNMPAAQRTQAPLVGFIIPVNGFGLWDAIYGYLAIKSDGDTVIGTTWYDQKETPGLGAEISEPQWQSQFPGKKIFQESSPGEAVDFKTAPIGITVVRGKVSDVLGTSPKAMSAVDGISGATLTGNGVTAAYKDSLQPYRAFLVLYTSGQITTLSSLGGTQ